MPAGNPLVLHHGPLDVCLRALDGCPELGGLVHDAAQSGVPVVWLDSARQHPSTGRWSLAGWDPWLTLTAHGDRVELRTSAATQAWRADPLEALRSVWRRYAPSARSRGATARPLPHARAVGLVGFLSYELNRWIERLPPPKAAGLPWPDMQWFAMRNLVLVDHVDRRTWVVGVCDPHRPALLARSEALDGVARAIERLDEPAEAAEPSEGIRGQPPISSGANREGKLVAVPKFVPTGALAPRDALQPWDVGLVATSTQDEFEAMVAHALVAIRAGEIFQANVSQRFTRAWRGSPVALYAALRRANPSPFACFLAAGERAVVSSSPERLVRVQGDRIDTRPIAGTRPRGATPADDALNALELLMSEKERAEHIMLVDLARNDLGRVSRPGSVGVSELMALEEYSHVIHIVSDVSGRLKREIDPVDVIRAVFPGGTITGCPKVRCMEILWGLEPVARGLYTGSLGYLGFDGTMDLNIAIRTIMLEDERLAFHVGAGIVADSDPSREYQETLAKAGAMVRALAHALGNQAVSDARVG